MSYEYTTPWNSIRWLEYTNGSGEEIPPFAAMRVSNADVDGIITGHKPNKDHHCQIYFNGPVAVAIGEKGSCTWDTPYFAYYHTADGTPAVDEKWGSENGSWMLHKGKAGFVIHGGVEDERVYVQRDPCHIIKGSGVPSFSADEGTDYWDEGNNIKYTNSDGGTTWIQTSGYDEISRIVWSPNEISGTTTLSANVGNNLRQWQYVSGTGPYTITLPPAANCQHEFLAFWFKSTLTGIVTLDGNSNEEIRGPRGAGGVVNRTRDYVKNEVVVLWCPDGLHWQVKHETMLEVAFIAINDSAQGSISSATPTKLTFPTLRLDINSGFASSTHTPLAPGTYEYKLTRGIASLDDAKYWKLMFYKNAALYRTLAQVAHGAAGNLILTGSAHIFMNGTTDNVEGWCEHNHGSALSTTAVEEEAVFSGRRMQRDVS